MKGTGRHEGREEKEEDEERVSMRTREDRGNGK